MLSYAEKSITAGTPVLVCRIVRASSADAIMTLLSAWGCARETTRTAATGRNCRRIPGGPSAVVLAPRRIQPVVE